MTAYKCPECGDLWTNDTLEYPVPDPIETKICPQCSPEDDDETNI